MKRCYKDLKTCGVRTYRTDENGEISIEVNRKGKITNFFCINLTKAVNTSKKVIKER